MSAPDPATLAVLAANYAKANKAEEYAGARVTAANEELAAAQSAYDAARSAARTYRSDLLNYSLSGGSA